MWDDIIIGKLPEGERRQQSAILCGTIGGREHSISHNNQAFWINDCILGLGCTIYKHTKEGKALVKMSKDGTGVGAVMDYVNQAVLKHADYKILRKAIQDTEEKHYQEGEDDKAKEIREALNII